MRQHVAGAGERLHELNHLGVVVAAEQLEVTRPRDRAAMAGQHESFAIQRQALLKAARIADLHRVRLELHVGAGKVPHVDVQPSRDRSGVVDRGRHRPQLRLALRRYRSHEDLDLDVQTKLAQLSPCFYYRTECFFGLVRICKIRRR